MSFLFTAPHPSITPAVQEGLLDLKSHLLGIREPRCRDSLLREVKILVQS